MILRCLLLILIATKAITQAEFKGIDCEFIETSQQGLQCEFNNVFTSETSDVNVYEENKSIESVIVRQSELYTVPSDIFRKFPSLTYLDVDMTQLKVIKPDNFHNANKLKDFLARFNEISSLESDTFASCPQIKSIVLQHNRISYIHPRAFYGIKNLESLYLDYNQMSSMPSNVLDHLPNLLHFSMAYNNLTSIPDDLFVRTERLETLNLGHNLLTSFDDEQFHVLQHLEHVQLDNNKLTELDLIACKASEINVDNNNLREIQLNKWTKIVSAWGNPVKKLILHEHYGTGRAYNFAFNEVSEIVFYVHEHCCTVENLENFYILTLSFGDLSNKGLDVNDWSCKFRKNVGYTSDRGYVTNNVCIKNEEQLTTTGKPIVSMVNVRSSADREKADDREVYTTSTSFSLPDDDYESRFDINEYTANIEEVSTTESTDTQTEKSIWKSIKSKASSLKNKAVNKWNTMFG